MNIIFDLDKYMKTNKNRTDSLRYSVARDILSNCYYNFCSMQLGDKERLVAVMPVASGSKKYFKLLILKDQETVESVVKSHMVDKDTEFRDTLNSGESSQLLHAIVSLIYKSETK